MGAGRGPRQADSLNGGDFLHKGSGIRRPVIRIFLNHSHHQAGDAGWDPKFWANLVDRAGRFLHLPQGDFNPAAFKWPAPRQHFIQHNP